MQAEPVRGQTVTERLDMYVTARIPGISRAFAAKLIERGDVLINGETVTKAGLRLKPQDKVRINFTTGQSPIPPLELPVLYEDDDCIVICKPEGVLTHSKGAFNAEATVASWLKPKVNGLDGDRAGIVHRLDRATSGVMICAKNPKALQWLQRQFAQRRTKKTYHALIVGNLIPPEAIIDMPIERNPKKPQTFRVGAQGKPAITAYRQLESGQRYGMVELKPETGRTHQLRVHLRKVGHPIVGDRLYGGEPASRLFLHAYQLELTLPNRQRQVYTAETPHEFLALVGS